MKHTSEIRWEDVKNEASPTAAQIKEALIQGEETYQELLELYQYAGSTAQGLADQLFKETWEGRSTPGTQAVITVDVAAGVVATPAVDTAGTGYPNGTGYTLVLTLTAGGGDAGAVLSYDVVAGAITNVAVVDGGTTYNDGTNTTVLEVPTPGVIEDTQANATEVSMAQDAIDAMTAIHQLFQAADNVAVTQSDRLTALRRMS